MLMLQQELSKKVWWNLKKRFYNRHKFSSHDINKFVILLRKWIYPDDWKQFNEISLLEKEDFWIEPNMEDITDANYTQR